MMFRKYALSIGVFVFVGICLTAVHTQLELDLLVFERFVNGGGWVEIIVISAYGAFLSYKMQDVTKAPKWRSRSWLLFSIVFFSQLILGLVGFEKFLMTGELHLPVPAMIISGPVYRGEITFMVFLFLSTVVLTGPAWCSHFCYLGGIDNAVARRKPNSYSWQNKFRVRNMFLFLLVLGTIILRIFHVHKLYALMGGISIGMAGVLFIVFLSSRSGKMANCVLFCPVGTLVTYLKYINPFRMYIDGSCNKCGLCSSACNYDALTGQDLEKGKPGISCTYCGDCLSVCHNASIKYKLFNLKPIQAKKVFLFLTVSVHAIFMALAKI